MGSERGDEYKKPCSLGEGTGSKESEYSEAPQRATTSRLVPTHQQDHRAVKRRCAPMMALKSFRTAAVTLAGVELAHRIRKGRVLIRTHPLNSRLSGIFGSVDWGSPAMWQIRSGHVAMLLNRQRTRTHAVAC
jgi:hypothetical protein